VWRRPEKKKSVGQVPNFAITHIFCQRVKL
jgi:hypothetical protein